MHNLMSRNQLDEWRHFEDTIDEFLNLKTARSVYLMTITNA